VIEIPKSQIPNQWDLSAEPRYKRQNMERAMRGKIERGLVELITNSDDSYRALEEEGQRTCGKIRIEIKRKRKGPSIVIVRDRATGMNREEMFHNLGTLGRRTSGFEKGRPRRGLHGRGARDVAAFGTVHFEAIKDEKYNHLVISPSLKCHFTEPHPKKATQQIRKKLGIPRGNGMVVTIEVDSRFKVPQHETLLKDFSRYYSLRDIFSCPNRDVSIRDLNTHREGRLRYRYPVGEVVFDDDIAIPDYPGATAHLTIHKHSTSFEQDNSPYREGILVKSAAGIHDCTHFGLEPDPFARRFTGELRCEFIDKLIREYDDREETNLDHPDHPPNNPMRLLDPLRDGLIHEHPFTRALSKRCREILERRVEEIKAAETPPKRDVSDENLSRKLNNLSREISKIFEKRLRELEEEVPPVTEKGRIKELPIGLHIIPPEEIPILVNQPKTFSIIVKNYKTLDASLPTTVTSSDSDVKVRTSPVYLKRFWENGKVGMTTFTVQSSKVGTEAFIEVRYDGYDNLVLVKVIEPPPPPPLPDGLSFDKPRYRLRINKEKTLVLWLKTTAESENALIAEISSDHPEIVVKRGGKCQFRKTDRPGVLTGKCRVLGRQLKARGNITAQVTGFNPAKTRVTVEEPSLSGVKLKFEPVEDDFGSVRYKWDDKDPYLLNIGAKHPSIKKYLGSPTEQGYSGINSPLYHAVLAEVIAEALAFRILEKQFKREGQEGMLDFTDTDSYYHRYLSEFLSIAHENLS